MTRLTEQQTWTDTDPSRQLKSRAEACVEIATKAVDVARTTRTAEVEWKAPGDAVTLADKASGTWIFDEVRKPATASSLKKLLPTQDQASFWGSRIHWMAR
jgi:hypothetical protein